MDIPRKKIIETLKENGSDQEISDTDSKIYDFLDSKLEKESTHSFSPGFVRSITRKIETKQERQLNMIIYILMSLLVIMIIPLLISFLNTQFISMLSTVFLQNKFTIAFLLFLVIFIQFGEKLIKVRKYL